MGGTDRQMGVGKGKDRQIDREKIDRQTKKKK